MEGNLVDVKKGFEIDCIKTRRQQWPDGADHVPTLSVGLWSAE